MNGLERSRHRRWQQGLTLVELMAAMAIGSIILGAISILFMVTSKTRDDLERHSRQVENGRYAMERLRDSIRLAGFFGEVLSPKAIWQAPQAAEDNCDAAFGWSASIERLPVGLSALDNPAGASPVSCVINHKPGTDVIFVRRVSTAETPVGTATSNERYLQNSMCSLDVNTMVLAVAPAAAQDATFTLRPRYCDTVPGGQPTRAPVRRVLHEVFYVGCTLSGSTCTDNPSLRRRQWNQVANAWDAEEIVVDGIEDLQVEFGVDANADGSPELPYITATSMTWLASPDTWVVPKTGANVAVALPQPNWSQVVAARVFVLSRSLTEDAQSFPQDTKRYQVGSAGVLGPYNDYRRRQLLSSVIQVSNGANWRESYTAPTVAAAATAAAVE